MKRGNTTGWNRRQLLKTTGIVAGVVAASQPVTASQHDYEAEVAVEFNNQESDGTSVEIEYLYTEVEAEVIIFHSEGDPVAFRLFKTGVSR